MIHVFRAGYQPAIKYRCDAGFWIKIKPTQKLKCFDCNKVRWAKNLVVQSHYDGDRFFCKEDACKWRK